MKILLEVQENKIMFFLELIKNFNFVKVKTNISELELTELQKKELDKRYDNYKKGQSDSVDWSIASENIEKRL
jgi:hypothetical protein